MNTIFKVWNEGRNFMSTGKNCFVIMGYGVKTDHTSGRVLDLDKTYENIIKPAVEELGLECKRADEVRHSGNIDIPMYKYLLTADIVIADLSTYNPNAFYELGVRHALRPFTTIAISEKKFKPPFDLSHTVIRQYEHLGSDIGYSEVMRFRKEMQEVIKGILDNPQTDSPVYTFLSDLKSPQWNSIDGVAKTDGTGNRTLSQIIEEAENALRLDDFMKAKTLFSFARSLDMNNIYIIQRLALTTYKAKHPNYVEALNEALQILEGAFPKQTTDPETLGLAGAIYKRLWEELTDKRYLDLSIKNYEKGFYIQSDYYNGINLAYLLNVRGRISDYPDSIADYVIANRVRYEVSQICEDLISSDDFHDRSDQYWIVATLEEAYYGLGSSAEYLYVREQALKITRAPWERETTEAQIKKLEGLLSNSPIK